MKRFIVTSLTMSGVGSLPSIGPPPNSTTCTVTLTEIGMPKGQHPSVITWVVPIAEAGSWSVGLAFTISPATLKLL